MKPFLSFLFLFSVLLCNAATGNPNDGVISAIVVVAIVLLVPGLGYLADYLKKRYRMAHEQGTEEDTEG